MRPQNWTATAALFGIAGEPLNLRRKWGRVCVYFPRARRGDSPFASRGPSVKGAAKRQRGADAPQKKKKQQKTGAPFFLLSPFLNLDESRSRAGNRLRGVASALGVSLLPVTEGIIRELRGIGRVGGGKRPFKIHVTSTQRYQKKGKHRPRLPKTALREFRKVVCLEERTTTTTTTEKVG